MKPAIGNVCHYCDGEFPKDQMTRDHIIPKSRGGRTNYRNLIGSCLPCNQAKSSEPPTCICDRCVRAYQYHRDLIESIRVHSEAWAAALISILGPETTALVYGERTYPSPAELGVTRPVRHLLRNIQ